MKTDPVTAIVIPSLPVLTARDVYSNASPLLTSRGASKMSTMFSLMEGQVHLHQIYLENVGTVPVHQIRMTLRMVVDDREQKRTSSSSSSSSRIVEVDVFASDENAPGTPARKRRGRTTSDISQMYNDSNDHKNKQRRRD